jgi:lipoate-protein ligase A
MICRVLPHEVRDGPANMAFDHALLDAVDADPTSAVLRTYAWSVPTLSLGYFQPFAEVEAHARWRGAAVVRRPTGGGALWHEHELTYALIVSRSHPSAARAADLYRTVHEAIASALRNAGIPAARRGPAERLEARPFLCFLDRDPEDLVVRGVKLVGSAQRRRPSAVLQHGSLLISSAATAPELPGLVEVAGASGEPAAWIEPLSRAILQGLRLTARPDEPSADERGRARRLEEEVYRRVAWTARR